MTDGGVPATAIRYDWPPGGGDPFALDEGPTRWVFATSEGNGWGRTWPAGDFGEFGGYGGFYDRVPMGYKAVLAYERLAVVLDGAVLGRWPETDTPSATSVLSREGGAFGVLPQSWVRLSDGPAPADAEQAVFRAVAESRAFPGVPMLAVRCLRQESWH
ncbi:hypothetical protein [Spirillospora sp. CA-294931]|uniref:hypothetical protein n=1 Tax=Spirillospora sp. CA-294931 TaxID=3240042 RepID=UPI003D8A635B